MFPGIDTLKTAVLTVCFFIFIRPLPGQQRVAGLSATTRANPTAPAESFAASGAFYISGKVTTEDGIPPPDTVTIERVCNGAARAQAYTDSKGRFGFQFGQTIDVLHDAVDGYAYLPGTAGASQEPVGSSTQLTGCRLRAILPGYRSDSVELSGQRSMDDENVGTIVLHRMSNVDGTTVSVTSLHAPAGAQRAYFKAREAVRKQRLPEARKQYQKAVDLYPRYPAAWYELGWVHQHQNQIEEARTCYAKALAVDAKFMAPYVELADLAMQAQNWRDVADTTNRLLELDPVDYPRAYLYNALANLNLSKLDAAEQSARAGVKLDAFGAYPKCEEVLAVILARKKDYAGAAEHMRSYLRRAPQAEDASQMRAQLGAIERLTLAYAAK